MTNIKYNYFDFEKYVLERYKIFKKIFFNKSLNYENRNIPIIFNTQDLDFDNKPKLFWHISSLGKENGLQYNYYKKRLDFNVFPCVNDKAYNMCMFKCDINNNIIYIKDYNNENRVPCVYRMSRIENFEKAINLFNLKSDKITYWTKRERSKSSGIIKDIFKIRYQEGIEDYVIIFEKKYNKETGKVKLFWLKSAYQLFDNNTKERFDKEYENYISYSQTS